LKLPKQAPCNPYLVRELMSCGKRGRDLQASLGVGMPAHVDEVEPIGVGEWPRRGWLNARRPDLPLPVQVLDGIVRVAMRIAFDAKEERNQSRVSGLAGTGNLVFHSEPVHAPDRDRTVPVWEAASTEMCRVLPLILGICVHLSEPGEGGAICVVKSKSAACRRVAASC